MYLYSKGLFCNGDTGEKREMGRGWSPKGMLLCKGRRGAKKLSGNWFIIVEIEHALSSGEVKGHNASYDSTVQLTSLYLSFLIYKD